MSTYETILLGGRTDAVAPVPQRGRLPYHRTRPLLPRPVDPTCVTDLGDAGFAVAVHSLPNCRGDFESCSMLRQPLPVARDAAQVWYAVRSLSATLHRGRNSLRSLGFDHSLPWPTTRPSEPQSGACCF
jgi:hypothetical protein